MSIIPKTFDECKFINIMVDLKGRNDYRLVIGKMWPDPKRDPVTSARFFDAKGKVLRTTTAVHSDVTRLLMELWLHEHYATLPSTRDAALKCDTSLMYYFLTGDSLPQKIEAGNYRYSRSIQAGLGDFRKFELMYYPKTQLVVASLGVRFGERLVSRKVPKPTNEVESPSMAVKQERIDREKVVTFTLHANVANGDAVPTYDSITEHYKDAIAQLKAN